MHRWLSTNKKKISDFTMNKILFSKFVKKKLSVLIMIIAAQLMSIAINVLVSSFFSFNYYVDTVVGISISVVLNLNFNLIYNIFIPYEKYFYKHAKDIIENYSFEKYCYYKRLLTLTLGSIIIITLLFIEVTSRIIIFKVIQMGIGIEIVSRIENYKVNDNDVDIIIHQEAVVDNKFIKFDNMHSSTVYSDVVIDDDFID